jgi:hypothetical protein
VRADLFAGLAINGSVSNAEAAKFCYNVCQYLFVVAFLFAANLRSQTTALPCKYPAHMFFF